jgi:hypothetical protein
MPRLFIERIGFLACIDCRIPILVSLAFHVPLAAGGVLRFASELLGDAIRLQFRISNKAADALDQGAFELVPDAFDALGIYPEQLIPARVGRVLCVANCPLGGSIRGELGVADGLAQALLDGSFDLVTDSFEATIFHNTVLRALFHETYSFASFAGSRVV